MHAAHIAHTCLFEEMARIVISNKMPYTDRITKILMCAPSSELPSDISTMPLKLYFRIRMTEDQPETNLDKDKTSEVNSTFFCLIGNIYRQNINYSVFMSYYGPFLH